MPAPSRALGCAGQGRSLAETSDPLNVASVPWNAVKRLLASQSQVQPLVLVFEDLHWIDSETQTVLDSLVESLPTTRFSCS